MKKIRLTVAMLLMAGTAAMAGTRLDIVNAPCKTISEALAYTLQQNNKPFSVGAKGEDAFDNPGLVVYTYKKLGVDTPDDMIKLSKTGKSISKIAKMQAGDIVFFSNPQNKKEIAKMGLVQSVASDGMSFTFFYADQKTGTVRIAHSSEDEFNGHFKQASRLLTDSDLADVRNEYQKSSTHIDKAKTKLKEAQDAVKEAEANLNELQSSFDKTNASDFVLK